MKLSAPKMMPTEYERQVIEIAKRRFGFLFETSVPVYHKDFAIRIESIFGEDMNAKLNEIVRVLKRF